MSPYVIKDVYIDVNVVITGRGCWEVVDVNVDVIANFEVVVLVVVLLVTVDVVGVVITGTVFWEVVDVDVDLNTNFEVVVLIVTENPKDFCQRSLTRIKDREDQRSDSEP
jgi:hypothetical protein